MMKIKILSRSNKVAKDAEFGEERPSLSISSSSESSDVKKDEVNNPFAPSVVTPTTVKDIFTKPRNRFVRFSADTTGDSKWNPFASGSGGGSAKSSSTRTSVKKFDSLDDLKSFLQENGDNYLSSKEIRGYCKQIVKFMESSEDDLDIQTNAGRTLYLLSLQDRSAREGRSNTRSGIKAILSAMENFPDDAVFQNQACLTLELLLEWEENQSIFLSTRGQVDLFYSAMESFRDDTELIIASLGSLYHLSCHPDAVESEIARDLAFAIPPILDLLKENRDHVDFFERGLSTLAKLTEDNPASQLLFCNDGQLGIRVAVDALHNQTFSENPKIQLAAMLILQHVASHSSLECKGKIVFHGGLDEILETLQQHSFHLSRPSGNRVISIPIMASALHTLANLSASKLKEHDPTRQRMGKAVSVILDTLKGHRDISQIQMGGFTSLTNLADLHANIIIRSGGISIIMSSMSDQMKNPAVQKQTCRTLVQLFSKRQSDAKSTNNILSGENNPSASEALDIVRAIAAENGIDIIFRSVRMHQQRRPVLEPAIESLYYLSCSRDLTPQQKEQLCLDENVAVLLGTISNYIESETICEYGCGLVLNMSFFAPLRQDGMANVGGIRIVLAVMRRHGLNAKIQEHGAGILSGLCLDGATHGEFMNEEGVSTVMSAMLVHPYQAGIQAFGCDVLLSIASANVENKEIVVEGNAKQVANDALIRHRKHRGVQNRASALLKRVS